MSKTGRYKYRVKNGYVEIRVVLSQGQPPRYFTGKTYREAERKADEAVRLAEKDIVTDRADWGNRPVGNWLDYWLNSVRRPQLQPTTYAKYEYQIRLYLKPHPIAAMKLQQVRYGDVEAWRDWLETAPGLKIAAWRAVRHRRYVRCGSGRTGLARKGAWQLSALTTRWRLLGLERPACCWTLVEAHRRSEDHAGHPWTLDLMTLTLGLP